MASPTLVPVQHPPSLHANLELPSPHTVSCSNKRKCWTAGFGTLAALLRMKVQWSGELFKAQCERGGDAWSSDAESNDPGRLATSAHYSWRNGDVLGAKCGHVCLRSEGICTVSFETTCVTFH